jgi:small subunit ribosomal protein S21
MGKPINVEIAPRDPREPADRVIRRFLKKVKKEGIIEEHRSRRYYEKPSDRKRREKIRRKRMAKRTQEKTQI